jgi:microcystin-dependent protein
VTQEGREVERSRVLRSQRAIAFTGVARMSEAKKYLTVIALTIGVAALVSAGVGMVVAHASELPSQMAAPAPLGSAFTYQGQLKSGGNLVNDACDMAFRLYDGASNDTQVGAAISTTVAITHGLFTVELDFGGAAFDGDARWLGIKVKCPGDAGYAELSRQALTAAPYALHALNADQLDGQDADDLLPPGVIVMWSGTLASIPPGWALCDGGEHGGMITPDLRDSFVYGASNGEDPGATGGATTHSHTYSDVPQHTHTASCSEEGEHSHEYEHKWYTRQVDSEGGGSSYTVVLDTAGTFDTSSDGAHSHTITIDSAGQVDCVTDEASTLPPYYKVAFIIKL